MSSPPTRAPLTSNRTMFWRIVRRLITAHRGRLFVILLALSAGATITAALLNLQVDAKRRLTTEFRAFGANVIVSAKASPASPNSPATPRLDDEIPPSNDGAEVTHVAFLYLSVTVNRYDEASPASNPIRVILAGVGGRNIQHILPARILDVSPYPTSSPTILELLPTSEVAGRAAYMGNCRVGEKVAALLQIHAGDRIQLTNRTNRMLCFVSTVEEFGGPEDNQILTSFFAVQELTWIRGETTSNNASLLLLNVPDTPQNIERYASNLQKQFPDLDVHPIRPFTQAQAKIYSRISGLLNFTVALVLILTGLCVMAAMTNVAMERRNDVGLMKAIGGAKRRVLRLFLAEATLLGLAGGIIGAAAGIALSIFLGKAVFGLAARPRLIVYPISVALTLIVAILSAFPLRRLASIRPASVFRGEA
ncbi:MAG TPA: ABC transporter permease [Candidatus Dormibacteraeota bacterium]|nr:ABC transporter permease [Candidatus Dormibacteraeota bacterium]